MQATRLPTHVYISAHLVIGHASHTDYPLHVYISVYLVIGHGKPPDYPLHVYISVHLVIGHASHLITHYTCIYPHTWSLVKQATWLPTTRVYIHILGHWSSKPPDYPLHVYISAYLVIGHASHLITHYMCIYLHTWSLVKQATWLPTTRVYIHILGHWSCKPPDYPLHVYISTYLVIGQASHLITHYTCIYPHTWSLVMQATWLPTTCVYIRTLGHWSCKPPDYPLHVYISAHLVIGHASHLITHYMCIYPHTWSLVMQATWLPTTCVYIHILGHWSCKPPDYPLHVYIYAHLVIGHASHLITHYMCIYLHTWSLVMQAPWLPTTCVYIRTLGHWSCKPPDYPLHVYISAHLVIGHASHLITHYMCIYPHTWSLVMQATWLPTTCVYIRTLGHWSCKPPDYPLHVYISTHLVIGHASHLITHYMCIYPHTWSLVMQATWLPTTCVYIRTLGHWSCKPPDYPLHVYISTYLVIGHASHLITHYTCIYLYTWSLVMQATWLPTTRVYIHILGHWSCKPPNYPLHVYISVYLVIGHASHLITHYTCIYLYTWSLVMQATWLPTTCVYICILGHWSWSHLITHYTCIYLHTWSLVKQATWLPTTRAYIRILGHWSSKPPDYPLHVYISAYLVIGHASHLITHYMCIYPHTWSLVMQATWLPTTCVYICILGHWSSKPPDYPLHVHISAYLVIGQASHLITHYTCIYLHTWSLVMQATWLPTTCVYIRTLGHWSCKPPDYPLHVYISTYLVIGHASHLITHYMCIYRYTWSLVMQATWLPTTCVYICILGHWSCKPPDYPLHVYISVYLVIGHASHLITHYMCIYPHTWSLVMQATWLPTTRVYIHTLGHWSCKPPDYPLHVYISVYWSSKPPDYPLHVYISVYLVIGHASHLITHYMCIYLYTWSLVMQATWLPTTRVYIRTLGHWSCKPPDYPLHVYISAHLVIGHASHLITHYMCIYPHTWSLVMQATWLPTTRVYIHILGHWSCKPPDYPLHVYISAHLVIGHASHLITHYMCIYPHTWSLVKQATWLPTTRVYICILGHWSCKPPDYPLHVYISAHLVIGHASHLITHYMCIYPHTWSLVMQATWLPTTCVYIGILGHWSCKPPDYPLHVYISVYLVIGHASHLITHYMCIYLYTWSLVMQATWLPTTCVYIHTLGHWSCKPPDYPLHVYISTHLVIGHASHLITHYMCIYLYTGQASHLITHYMCIYLYTWSLVMQATWLPTTCVYICILGHWSCKPPDYPLHVYISAHLVIGHASHLITHYMCIYPHTWSLVMQATWLPTTCVYIHILGHWSCKPPDYPLHVYISTYLVIGHASHLITHYMCIYPHTWSLVMQATWLPTTCVYIRTLGHWSSKPPDYPLHVYISAYLVIGHNKIRNFAKMQDFFKFDIFKNMHMPSTLQIYYKIVITLLLVGKNKWMADYTIAITVVSSRSFGAVFGSPSSQKSCIGTNAYLEKLHRHQCLPGKAAQAPMLTWKSCIGTNAYLEKLHRHQCLPGKAAQAPMLTWKSCTGTNAYLEKLHRHQCLPGKAAQAPMLTWKSCIGTNAYLEKLHRHQCLPGKAAQAPMLTWKSCTGTNAYLEKLHRHQCLPGKAA